MIAVIFEVTPAEDQQQAYLDQAAKLKPLVGEVEGFLGVERFRSLTDPDKILSLSFFEDENAVTRWRNLPEHRASQEAGRAGVFSNYRLRVAEVQRDYGMSDRADAPEDSKSHHGG